MNNVEHLSEVTKLTNKFSQQDTHTFQTWLASGELNESNLMSQKKWTFESKIKNGIHKKRILTRTEIQSLNSLHTKKIQQVTLNDILIGDLELIYDFKMLEEKHFSN